MSNPTQSSSSWRRALSGHADKPGSQLRMISKSTGKENSRGQYQRRSFSSTLAAESRKLLPNPNLANNNNVRDGKSTTSVRSNIKSYQMNRQSRVPPAAPGTSNEARNHRMVPNVTGASDVGSDIVEYGASVQTQDDQRRTIHIETQEIDASNAKTETFIEKQSQLEEQLTKDIGHIKMELCSLNQGASDQLDNARMFSTLTKNLKDELETGIVRSIVPTTKITSSSASNHLQCVNSGKQSAESSVQNSPSKQIESNALPMDLDSKKGSCTIQGDSKKGEDNKNTLSSLSNKEIIDNKRSRANALLRSLRDREQELLSTCKDTEAVDEKSAQLEKVMESQDLETTLQRACNEVNRLHADVKQDEDTVKTLSTEIQQTQESCEKKGQKCTELVKQLGELKEANRKEEEKLRQKLEHEMAEVKRLEKVKEEKLDQIEKERRKLDEMLQLIADYEDYCKTKIDHETWMEERNKKKNELAAQQNELNRQRKQEEEKMQKLLLEKEKILEIAQQAESREKEKRELNAVTLRAIKEELAKLSEQKVKLADQISDTKKTWDTDRAKEEANLARKQETLANIQKEARLLQQGIQAKKKEIEEETKKHEEYQKAQEEQIAAHDVAKKKFLAMYREAKREYKKRYEERRDELSAKYLQELRELKANAKANKLKLEVFERAVQKLEVVRKMEQEANEE